MIKGMRAAQARYVQVNAEIFSSRCGKPWRARICAQIRTTVRSQLNQSPRQFSRSVELRAIGRLRTGLNCEQ
jgi:hypothetical protein